VDAGKLEKHYWALQRKLHPDNFHTATTVRGHHFTFSPS
jgi:DnaJ-domain-containing protein 1